MTTRQRRSYLLLSGWIALLLACDDAPSGLDGSGLLMSGAIRVTVKTTGSSLDAYGYRVTVDGRDWKWIGINATEAFGALAEGEHDLELTYVAPNCVVNGANPQSVEVGPAETSSTIFDVECAFVRRGIAFTADREGDGNAEIYAIDPDSTYPVRLTADPANDYDPAWSPDGTQIAFATDRDGNAEIYLMDAGGGALVRLTNDPARDYDPAWSPDGTKIAFVSNRDSDGEIYNEDIYIMDAGGMNLERLTNDVARDFNPTWSPDGSKIAFTRGTGLSADDGSGIYVMDVGGTNLRRLVHDPAGDGRPAWSPSWSPDGMRLAFTYGAGGWFGDGEVWVIDADGSNLAQLTAANSMQPVWSPDGTKIAFSRSSGWGGNDRIWIMDADGANPVELTPDGLQMSYAPAWAP